MNIDTLREVIEPLVRARRCDLYDIEVNGGTRAQTVRVLIDSETGVDTEACATVSRLVERALDELEGEREGGPKVGRYTLEVSSPGLERPLRTPRHFELAAKRAMTVRVALHAETIVGTLLDTGESSFSIKPGDPHQPAFTVRYDDVVNARTVFNWGEDRANRTNRAPSRAKLGERPTADG